MKRVPATDLVRLATVATAHGVRGALKLRCYTDDPRNVADYGPVFDESGKRLFELRVDGVVKGGVIVQADGIADRNAAELLRGKDLFVPRGRLPEADDDEFYPDDLVGLDVIGPDGVRVGTVTAVHDFGAGDVLAFEDDDGREYMLPFIEQYVPAIDLDMRQVSIAEAFMVEPA
ncbi:MAG: 16S rRNA processing protein RimM [Geminicoccaceae bacterium]|nr:16S rRNA processing protein RimM [Geminicoccaceae bacterium]